MAKDCYAVTTPTNAESSEKEVLTIKIHKAMKTKKYWYCEEDRMGQRSGNYCSVELPECFVIKKGGCLYSAIDTVHNTGVIEKHTFLYTSETEAQRAALS